MVVGGGIAGLTAAWELAGQNIQVELVEKSCFLGGHSIGFTCKATDECRQCGACSVEQMLANVVNEPLINVHLRTEIQNIEKGEKFSVVLEKSNIDISGTGLLKGFSQHNSPMYVAGDKASSMPDGAAKIDTLGTEGKFEVDSIVIATGFSPFDPKLKSTFGYGEKKNIITGMDLENLLRKNSSLVRPSDGNAPEKIAFIQCVGSRDERLGNLWCSEVCCPYAMRMASLIKHKKEDTDISIFYIDIQNTAKEFPIFYEQVKNDVTFKRTIPVDIYQIENDRLNLRYMPEESSSPLYEEFDLIVLSVGIMPGSDIKAISEKCAVGLNEFGFLNDSGEGIFTAGTVKGPGTIFDTIADSEKAAYETMKYLGVIK
ncbi:MAG: CoB--CoM heterodisulfide reductase iron-sulfur subunit A family protein [Desulfobacteraceae bacterium]|nr:CoB--CoM heterodisulfide reductase iron-sulfur subunit A family protein [Desulfobacteraceae bacterium]